MKLKKSKNQEKKEKKLEIKKLKEEQKKEKASRKKALNGIKKERKKNLKNSKINEDEKIEEVRVKGKKKKKERRKWWKILLTLFILGCIMCIFAVFAFCLYIVVTTGEFDPNALANKDRSIIYDMNGKEISTLSLENRESIKYEQLPEVLVDAIIATEDSRFFQHNGVDTARFIKAAIQQVLGNSSAGGASTLTMQVVKNNLTSTDRDIIRKFRDVYLAVFFMERKYTKEEILEFYVNDSSLGGGTFGVEEASKYYFGKSASQLNLPEAAMIAGLFQAPYGNNPYTNPGGATKRRNTVLKLMVRHGYITQEEADVANSIDINSMLVGIRDENFAYQSYIDEVIDEVQRKTENSPYNVPMKIYTNLNPDIQNGLSNILSGNTSDYTWIDDYVQAGITILDVKTGAIVAIGGGRNRNVKRSWNYATNSYRQPGSTAKPVFAYGPGFEYDNFSTYELFNDEPWTYSDGTKLNNWDAGYKGLITLKKAVADSRNIPAVKAFQQVGAKDVANFVQSLGIDLHDVAYEAYAIGGIDPGVTTVEMAAAYAAFANGGYYAEPYTVSKIVYRETGEEVDMRSESNRVMKDSTAYLVTNVLEYAAHNGFSGGTNNYRGTVAVKTGTSNYPSDLLRSKGLPPSTIKDLWSVAYTPQYSISLWYGYDDLSTEYYSTNSTKKDELMRAVMKYIPVCNDKFEMPSSVVASQVEFGSWPAMLPSEYTPSDLIITEYFIKGTQPTEVSPRYTKFANVSGVKSKNNGGSIDLTWEENKPEFVTEDYLKNYYGQHVFGHQGSNYLANRIASDGEFGYGIYSKDILGNLKFEGFVTANNFNIKVAKNGTYTYVIKTQYKNYTGNASEGVTVKVIVDDVKNNSDKISVKLSGSDNITVNAGSYVESGVKVFDTSDNKEITDECDISYNISNDNDLEPINITVTSQDLFETKINALSPGDYKITYNVDYNSFNKKIFRKLKIK